MKLTLALAILALCVPGCGREHASASDSSTPLPVATSVAARTTTHSACPKTGHWSGCLVLERLERSGLAPQRNATIPDLPALGGTSERYMIGNAALAVYLFPDTLSRRRAAAALDGTRFIPPTRAVGMQGEATAIENDNLLALLFSRNEQQRERVADALTAGPPQP